MSEADFIDRARAVVHTVDAVVDAVTSHRAAAAHLVLDRAAESLGPGPCIDDVLMPAIRRIAGRQPVDNETGRVRLAVETARAWLESNTACAPAPHQKPPLILACGPGDRHSLGLEALVLLLRYEREPCRMLGPRVSAARMSVAVAVNRPNGVLLVAHRESSRRASTDVLHDLNDIGMPTYYAGAAFDPVLARQGVPGIYLGTSFQGACATILQSLAAERACTPPRTA